jgi:hypothetical protein
MDADCASEHDDADEAVRSILCGERIGPVHCGKHVGEGNGSAERQRGKTFRFRTAYSWIDDDDMSAFHEREV